MADIDDSAATNVASNANASNEAASSGGVLDGQVVAITGAGAGLGRAYALAFARTGAAVVVNDRDREAASAVVAEIEAMGGAAVADDHSVGDLAAAEAIVATALDAFDRLDVMVTNAGADRRAPVLDLEAEDWTMTLGVHLQGSIFCSIAAARAMRDQGSGCIVNVTSAAFYGGTPTMAPYSVSKGGIYSLTRVLAQELAPFGISVNAVAPPLTATGPALAWIDSLADMGLTSEQVAGVRATAEQTDQVAPIVVYLATPAGRKLQGHVFTLTKGSLESIEPPVAKSVQRSGGGDGPWSLDELQAAVESLTTPT